MEEKVFLDELGVKVTNSRFMLANETYAMSGVVSVKTEVIPGKPGRRPPTIVERFANAVLAVVIFGWLGHFLFSTRQSVLMLLGVASFALMLAALWVAGTDQGEPDGPPTYAVVLRTSSQELRALEDKDKTYIDRIVNALNQAIVSRG